jgi:hypothetical protein
MPALQGNGDPAPSVKRGRGRPRKVKAPPESFTDQQIARALREADAIVPPPLTVARLIANYETHGLHKLAFLTTRKLAKAGPLETKMFLGQLARYLGQAGLLEPAEQERPAERQAA